MTDSTTRVLYSKATNTLGNLIEVKSTFAELYHRNVFGAVIHENSQPYPDYFRWREYHIYHDGKCEDIKVKDVIFSKIVKSEHSDHFYKGSCHKICLSGEFSDGENFSFKGNCISNLDEMVNFIYAIIVISECNNLKMAHDVWDILTQSSMCKDINYCIEAIYKIRNFLQNISLKFPFMKNLLKNRLSELKQMAIADLDILCMIE